MIGIVKGGVEIFSQAFTYDSQIKPFCNPLVFAAKAEGFDFDGSAQEILSEWRRISGKTLVGYLARANEPAAGFLESAGYPGCHYDCIVTPTKVILVYHTSAGHQLFKGAGLSFSFDRMSPTTYHSTPFLRAIGRNPDYWYDFPDFSIYYLSGSVEGTGLLKADQLIYVNGSFVGCKGLRDGDFPLLPVPEGLPASVRYMRSITLQQDDAMWNVNSQGILYLNAVSRAAGARFRESLRKGAVLSREFANFVSYGVYSVVGLDDAVAPEWLYRGSELTKIMATAQGPAEYPVEKTRYIFFDPATQIYGIGFQEWVNGSTDRIFGFTSPDSVLSSLYSEFLENLKAAAVRVDAWQTTLYKQAVDSLSVSFTNTETPAIVADSPEEFQRAYDQAREDFPEAFRVLLGEVGNEETESAREVFVLKRAMVDEQDGVLSDFVQGIMPELTVFPEVTVPWNEVDASPEPYYYAGLGYFSKGATYGKTAPFGANKTRVRVSVPDMTSISRSLASSLNGVFGKEKLAEAIGRFLSAFSFVGIPDIRPNGGSGSAEQRMDDMSIKCSPDYARAAATVRRAVSLSVAAQAIHRYVQEVEKRTEIHGFSVPIGAKKSEEVVPGWPVIPKKLQIRNDCGGEVSSATLPSSRTVDGEGYDFWWWHNASEFIAPTTSEGAVSNYAVVPARFFATRQLTVVFSRIEGLTITQTIDHGGAWAFVADENDWGGSFDECIHRLFKLLWTGLSGDGGIGYQVRQALSDLFPMQDTSFEFRNLGRGQWCFESDGGMGQRARYFYSGKCSHKNGNYYGTSKAAPAIDYDCLGTLHPSHAFEVSYRVQGDCVALLEEASNRLIGSEYVVVPTGVLRDKWESLGYSVSLADLESYGSKVSLFSYTTTMASQYSRVLCDALGNGLLGMIARGLALDYLERLAQTLNAPVMTDGIAAYAGSPALGVVFWWLKQTGIPASTRAVSLFAGGRAYLDSFLAGLKETFDSWRRSEVSEGIVADGSGQVSVNGQEVLLPGEMTDLSRVQTMLRDAILAHEDLQITPDPGLVDPESIDFTRGEPDAALAPFFVFFGRI